MLFSAYDGQQRDIQRTTVGMTVVTTVLVACRLRLVWNNNKRFFWEDAFVVMANVWLIVFAIVVYLATMYGFGKHLTDVQRSGGDFKTAMKFFWLAQTFYTLCIGSTKLSFLALYRHIFGGVDRVFRHCCLCLGIICLAWMTAYVLAAIFQCTPIPRTWDRTIPGECFSFPAHRWSHAATNLTTDLIVLVIPVWHIRNLQVSRATRVGLFFICSIGVFVCLITVLRMTTLPLTLTTKEPTWASAPTFLWSFIESATAVICLCLISFHGPLKAFWTRLTNSAKGTSSRLHPQASSAYGERSGFGRRDDMLDTTGAYYELKIGKGSGRDGTQMASDDAASNNGSETGIMEGIKRTTRVDVQVSQVPLGTRVSEDLAADISN